MSRLDSVDLSNIGKGFVVLLFLTLVAPRVFSWSGYNWDSGSYVDIESGNLVRTGNDIEIYDWDSGEYRDVNVESIYSYGYSTEVEVYDWDSGEYITLDMDSY